MSAWMFGRIRAWPLEIMGVFYSSWNRQDPLCLTPLKIRLLRSLVLRNLYLDVSDRGLPILGREGVVSDRALEAWALRCAMVPQHAARQASQRGWLKSGHWQKGSRWACSLSSAGTARAPQHCSAWSRSLQRISAGWGGTACPNCVLGGREGGKALPGWTATAGRAGFQFPAFSSCWRGEQRNVFQLCSAALCRRQSSSPLSISVTAVGVFCRAHMGTIRSMFVLITLLGRAY